MLVHHETTAFLNLLQKGIESLAVQDIVGDWPQFQDCQKGSIGGRQMWELSVSTTEPFTKATLQSLPHFESVLLVKRAF